MAAAGGVGEASRSLGSGGGRCRVEEEQRPRAQEPELWVIGVGKRGLGGSCGGDLSVGQAGPNLPRCGRTLPGQEQVPAQSHSESFRKYPRYRACLPRARGAGPVLWIGPLCLCFLLG